MKRSQVYDEKQIQDRGKVYQYSFVAALITIAAAFFVTQALEVHISAYALFLFCLWIPITVCLILLIWKNAYEGVGSKAGRITVSVLGAGGAVMVGYALWEVYSGRDALFLEGMVSDRSGSLFAGICMVMICCAYWIKQFRDRNRFTEE